MGRPVGQRIAVADHDARAAVVEAVVELLVRDPPREWDEDGAGPLRCPVEERRFEPVVEHDGDPLAGLDAEAAGEALDAVEQLAVAKPGNASSSGWRSQAASSEAARFMRSPSRSTHASIASTIGV